MRAVGTPVWVDMRKSHWFSTVGKDECNYYVIYSFFHNLHPQLLPEIIMALRPPDACHCNLPCSFLCSTGPTTEQDKTCNYNQYEGCRSRGDNYPHATFVFISKMFSSNFWKSGRRRFGDCDFSCQGLGGWGFSCIVHWGSWGGRFALRTIRTFRWIIFCAVLPCPVRFTSAIIIHITWNL